MALGLISVKAGVPYKDHIVPCIIQAEDFDQGGSGVGYYDTTPENIGAYDRPAEDNALYNAGAPFAYREDAPDVDFTSPAPGEVCLNYIEAGEWYEYTFQVQVAGVYDIIITGAGHWTTRFDFSIDEEYDLFNGAENQTTNLHGYIEWFPTKSFYLSEGEHVMRIKLTSNFASLDKFEFVLLNNTPYAGYEGEPLTVKAEGALIEAEYFDNGGLGSAYSIGDKTRGGAANSQRTDEIVPIRPDNGEGWGDYIILGKDDWTKYTIDVESGGGYDGFVSGRLKAAAGESGTVYLWVDNKLLVQTVVEPEEEFLPVIELKSVDFSAGKHVIRLEYKGAGDLLVTDIWIQKHVAPAPFAIYDFDDPNDLKKLSEGSSPDAFPLEFYTSGHSGIGDPLDDGIIIPTTGPKAGDGAIFVPLNAKIKVKLADAAEDVVLPADQRIRSYTMLWDMKPNADANVTKDYLCLFQERELNTADGALFVQPAGKGGSLGLANNTKTPNVFPDDENYGKVWKRIVFSMNDGDIHSIYIDGELIFSLTTTRRTDDEGRRFILGNYFWLFGDENSEDWAVDCAKFVVWKDAVSIADITELGWGGSPTQIQKVEPATGKVYAENLKLHFNGISSTAAIEVYNIAGQKIASSKAIGNQTLKLPATGLYIVRVNDKGKSEGFKVLAK